MLVEAVPSNQRIATANIRTREANVSKPPKPSMLLVVEIERPAVQDAPKTQKTWRRMEVTADNLALALPLIQKAISDASFVALDCELTGLRFSDSPRMGYRAVHTVVYMREFCL